MLYLPARRVDCTPSRETPMSTLMASLDSLDPETLPRRHLLAGLFG
jgi:hypothetical protein